MMVLQVKRSSDLGILTLDGELTMQRVDDLSKFLKSALDCVNNVVLNLEYVTGVDVSCIQQLCSSRRAAILLKKCLTLDGGRPDIFKSAVKAAGFPHCADCVVDRNSCTWRVHLESRA